MTTMQVIALVGMFVLLDTIVVTTILRMAVSEFDELHKPYPAREPAPDAVRKNFQGFKIGLIGLGWSIHVAVDDHYLHLSPSRFARILRMKPVSIPWEAIKVVKRGRWNCKCKIGKSDIIGPTWCMNLA